MQHASKSPTAPGPEDLPDAGQGRVIFWGATCMALLTLGILIVLQYQQAQPPRAAVDPARARQLEQVQADGRQAGAAIDDAMRKLARDGAGRGHPPE